MPEKHLKSTDHFGFYGKLPITGDFINRGLPNHFIHRWDNWLHDNLSAYQQHYQDKWLQHYLTSPIWRFFISPSIIDDNAYIGIMCPSVDSVGRYFPMTIASPCDAKQIHSLFSPSFQLVYGELEQLFFKYLNSSDSKNVESFHHELQEISSTFQHFLSSQKIDPLPATLDSYRFLMSDQADIAGAVSSLWLMQIIEKHPSTTLWWSNGSNAIEPSLLINSGLPNKNQFIDMFSNFNDSEHWRENQLLLPAHLKLNIENNDRINPQPEAPVQEYEDSDAAESDKCPPNIDEPILPSDEELAEREAISFSKENHLILNDNTLINEEKIAPKESESSNDQLLDMFLDSENPTIEQVTAPKTNCDIELSSLKQEYNDNSTLISQSYGFSEVGHVRAINEDAILIHNNQSLWVVADGMGGHSAGDKASQMIIEQLKYIELQGDLFSNIDQIKTILKNVNSEILSFARSQNTTCGSTVVILIQNKDQCAYLWAGDSRIYLYRNNELMQLSTDHSLQNEINHNNDKATLAASNIITRAVGVEDELEIESGFHQLKQGDRFLLCSDGLYGSLSDDDIKQGISLSELQVAGCYMKEKVLEGDAKDNLSAILISL